LNLVILTGRASTEPNVYITKTGVKIVAFPLAVKRRFKYQDIDTDFIYCKAFGSVANDIEDKLYKGVKVSVVGRINTGSYTNKQGIKVYSTEVHIAELNVLEHTKAYKELSNNFDNAPIEYSNSIEGFKSSGSGLFEIPNYMGGFLDIDEALSSLGIDPEELPFR